MTAAIPVQEVPLAPRVRDALEALRRAGVAGRIARVDGHDLTYRGGPFQSCEIVHPHGCGCPSVTK